MKLAKILLLVGLLPAAVAPVRAQSSKCAAEKMQLFYHYLADDNGASVRTFRLRCAPGEKDILMPSWLEKLVPAMRGRKVWKDQYDGEVSEAAIWQTPVSILYEFADATAKNGAKNKKEYEDIRLRLMLSLDRIKRAKLESSFGGRGAGMLSSLNLIMERFDKITEPGAENEDIDKNSAEIFRLTESLFMRLFSEPAQGPVYAYKPAARVLPGWRGVTLEMPGHQLLFLDPGDRIDLIITFEALLSKGTKEPVAATILQNLLVLNVSKPAGPAEKGAVQVLCNPVEAQYAVLSLAQGKTATVARRPEGDLQMKPMQLTGAGAFMAQKR